MFVLLTERAQVEGSKVMSLDPEKLPPQPASYMVQELIAHSASEFEKNASQVVNVPEGSAATEEAPEVYTSSTSVAAPGDKLVVQSLT